jgi:predicted acylesterase/phospholipase RssA
MASEGIGGEAVALVLAGAVAKGPFAVGAISALAAKGLTIGRIAATSSGALTAAVIGAGAATGQLAKAAAVASELWLDHGAWMDIQHVSLGDWLHARGLLDTTRVAKLVEEGIRRVVEPSSEARARCRVTFATTSLLPLPDAVSPLPTYERAVHFESADFVAREKWPAIALAAAASATFPGVFAPTALEGRPCIDGGAVNNGPIGYVLDEPSVRIVLVVTSEAREPAEAAELGGVNLIGRIADIAINERISHDLGVASRTNERLRGVKAALESTRASRETTDAVLRALGWRELDLVLIGPHEELPGTSFSGFFHRELRQQYMQAGEQAATDALARYFAQPAASTHSSRASGSSPR